MPYLAEEQEKAMQENIVEDEDVVENTKDTADEIKQKESVEEEA